MFVLDCHRYVNEPVADVGIAKEVSKPGSSEAQRVSAPPIRFGPVIEFTVAISDALDEHPPPTPKTSTRTVEVVPTKLVVTVGVAERGPSANSLTKN